MIVIEQAIEEVMSRLPRPSIPTKSQLEVVLRQIGLTPYLIKLTIDHAIAHRQSAIHRDFFLELYADKIGCVVADFNLDHDPALENREKLVELESGIHRRVILSPKGARVLRYFPDANDPDYLFYRPHAALFARSHKVKTLVRGDHGQHSDAGLQRKLKNIARNRDPYRKKAKIQSANRWPPRGSQKIPSRKK